MEQLRRKLSWVRDNLGSVCKALSSQLVANPVIEPTQIAGALVTLHPTYASYFIADFPCVPLTELIDGFKDKGGWPYKIGVFNV